MKKLIGVSILAVLTVIPMTADAAIAPLPLQNGGTVPASTQVATTSYVKGAYNSVANTVNSIISDITVTDIEGGYTHIDATKSVADNLVSLNNAITAAAGTSSSTYTTQESAAPEMVEGATQLYYATENGSYIGKNLGALDNAVHENATAITTLNSDDTTPGSVAYAVKGEETRAMTAETALSNRIGTLSANGSYIDTTSDVYTNMTALDSQVRTNELHIGTMDALRQNGNLSTIESRSTLVSAINTLDAAISSAGTASNVASGHYIGQNNGKESVAENLTALDNEVYNINTNKIGSTEMGTEATTVTGAIKEMHDQTIEVATTWNSDQTEEVSLFPPKTTSGD